jgi:hypothetical protein
MKVFISWSGDVSHKVAIALREWLPSVIQSLKPYVSSEDIDKGARWSTDISQELEDSLFGILCITEDNIEAPWLNFEAGALSKSVDKSRVSPFLFRVKRSDIRGPLLQFQSTIFDKAEVYKLVHSLNSAEETPTLDETRIDQIFEVWWPKLDEALNAIDVPAETASKKASRRSAEPVEDSPILEEMLELLRSQHRLLNTPHELLPARYLEAALGRSSAIPPGHPVYRQLEHQWRELRSLLASFEEEEKIPTSVIVDLVGKLDRPIDFILSRSHRRVRAAWGSPSPGPEALP